LRRKEIEMIVRKINIILFAFLLLTAMTVSALALDVTANSCSEADVQSAVDKVISGGGGTVYIPAGNCTWTNGVVLNTGPDVDVRIIGAGQGQTVITDFYLKVPTSGSNLVELAYMSIDGASRTRNITSEPLRPASGPGKELNWHHLTISGRGPIVLLEGWYGVVHHSVFKCRSGEYGFYVHGFGNYDKTRPPMGTRNALFFEDNVFDGCYHSISGFCNSKIVFRKNTIRNASLCVDVHGPSYDYCKYADPVGTPHGGRLFEHYNNVYESTNVCGALIRSGSGISTGNVYEFKNGWIYFGLMIDGGAGSGGCGDCSHVLDYPCTNGVCEGPQDFWVWGETGCGSNCFGTYYDTCSGCIREGVEYFLRAPTVKDDGFTWTPFQYPHPLVTGGSTGKTPSPPQNLKIVQ